MDAGTIPKARARVEERIEVIEYGGWGEIRIFVDESLRPICRDSSKKEAIVLRFSAVFAGDFQVIQRFWHAKWPELRVRWKMPPFGFKGCVYNWTCGYDNRVVKN
jgi:hypothetical protein